MTTQADLADSRILCAHCGSRYDPAVVKRNCPVCRTPAPGWTHTQRGGLGGPDRMLLIVAVATLTNLLVLAVLAALLLS